MFEAKLAEMAFRDMLSGETNILLISKATLAGIIVNGAPERGHIVHLVMGKDHLRVFAHPKKDKPVGLLKQDNPLTVDQWHRVRL